MHIGFVSIIVGITYLMSAMTVYFCHSVVIDDVPKSKTKIIRNIKIIRFWSSCLPIVNTVFMLVFLVIEIPKNKDEKKK